MATIKSYTDIEQSKKLAEILPLESADGVLCEYDDGSWHYEEWVDKPATSRHEQICWSLAALLGILPVIIGDVLSENALRLRVDKGETEFAVWYDNLDSGMVEGGLDIIKSNAVDACYEMVIRLNELKML